MQFLAGLMLQHLLRLLGDFSFTASVRRLPCAVLAGQGDELALSSLICPSEELLYSSSSSSPQGMLSPLLL